MCSTCCFDPAVCYTTLQSNLLHIPIGYSNNNGTATKNCNGNTCNDHIWQFSLPWFREILLATFFLQCSPPHQNDFVTEISVSHSYASQKVKCRQNANENQYYNFSNMISPVLRVMQIPGHKESLKRRCSDPRMCWQLAGRVCAMHAEIRLRLCLRVCSQLQT